MSLQIDLQKVSWILTYDATCNSIGSVHFEEYTKIPGAAKLLVDECYTTVEGDSKHTMIHLEKRLRECSIRKFLAFMETTHNIVTRDFRGYVRLKSSPVADMSYDICFHPLYLLMLKHKNENNPIFESWTKLNRPASGGLFQRHRVNEHGVLVRQSKPKRPLEAVLEDSEVAEAPVPKLYVKQKAEKSEPTRPPSDNSVQAPVPKLCFKQKAEKSKPTRPPSDDSVQAPVDDDGFDVVQKHNTIVATNQFVGSDVTATLLGSEEAAEYFLTFSSEVWNSLLSPSSRLIILCDAGHECS